MEVQSVLVTILQRWGQPPPITGRLPLTSHGDVPVWTRSGETRRQKHLQPEPLGECEEHPEAPSAPVHLSPQFSLSRSSVERCSWNRQQARRHPTSGWSRNHNINLNATSFKHAVTTFRPTPEHVTHKQEVQNICQHLGPRHVRLRGTAWLQGHSGVGCDTGRAPV